MSLKKTKVLAITDWTCTDPDNFQYGRKVSDGIYEFKEFNRNAFSFEETTYEGKKAFITSIFDKSEYWEEMTIVMKHYNDGEIDNHISAYYDSLEQLKEIYGDDWEWIVAECIFEQESGLY